MKKRILPALLALCMVMSLLPVAFATAGENGCECTGAEDTCKGYADGQAAHEDGKCTGTPAEGETLCSVCKKDAAPPDAGDGDDGDGDDGDGDDTPAECTGGTDCAAPAGTHKNTGFDDGEGGTTAACKKYVACGVNGCELDKGHEADHAFAEGKDVCLGYAADERCSATDHIAGCPNYDCECGPHTDTGWNEGEGALTCTHKAGCPLCAAWNSHVSGKVAEFNTAHKEWEAKKAAHEAWENADESTRGDEPAAPGAEPTLDEKYVACTCADCRPNPAMGVVTDENGNAVDPTEPTDPAEPEAPKAEDFTDMEDWMAADVQVALDKGWLEGYGDGTFNGRGVTKGTTIAAALARMAGETITGADWDKDALAWAEDQDVFEGIDLTGESMARKDLVLVIWRMAGKPAAEKELDFTDVDGLEGDHLTAMQWAVENGIVKGNGDGTVTPDGSVNRAALCTMLARYDSLEK